MKRLLTEAQVDLVLQEMEGIVESEHIGGKLSGSFVPPRKPNGCVDVASLYETVDLGLFFMADKTTASSSSPDADMSAPNSSASSSSAPSLSASSSSASSSSASSSSASSSSASSSSASFSPAASASLKQDVATATSEKAAAATGKTAPRVVEWIGIGLPCRPTAGTYGRFPAEHLPAVDDSAFGFVKTLDDVRANHDKLDNMLCSTTGCALTESANDRDPFWLDSQGCVAWYFTARDGVFVLRDRNDLHGPRYTVAPTLASFFARVRLEDDLWQAAVYGRSQRQVESQLGAKREHAHLLAYARAYYAIQAASVAEMGQNE